MSNKSYGINCERKEVEFWRNRGFTANRNRGSFGCADVIAFKADDNNDELYFIQVKSTKVKTPFKKELDDFIKLRLPRCVCKWFVIYENGKRRVIYTTYTGELK